MKATSFKQTIFMIIGALFLMIDAFYNGFPIVYSDTSTYIASGFELEAPFDRPITYGLFTRVFSFNGFSPWFVVFFQALLLSYLIFQLVKLIIGEKLFLQLGLLTIVFLSLLTGISWTVSQLMPDLFTSTALIGLTLILFGRFSRSTTILLHALFFISVAMHMSHILLFSLILLTILVLRKFILPSQVYPDGIKKIGVLFLLTLASIITMGSAMSKSKHVFFMGSMVEKGILKKYLDENCETNKYRLCAYKDSLPLTFTDFVWKENSPFYKIGSWKETKSEFNEIIYATLTQPKYIVMHVKESIQATFRQLIHFGVGDGNGSFLEGTLLHERISKYFKNDLTKYATSKQSQSQLGFTNRLNWIFSTVILLSLIIVVILLLFFKNRLNGQIKSIGILFILTILLNTWNCGTFSMVADRFGCKIIWLLPFITAIALLKIFQNKQYATRSNDAQ